MYDEIQMTAMDNTLTNFPDADWSHRETVIFLASVPMSELVDQDVRFRRGTDRFNQMLYDMKVQYDQELHDCVRKSMDQLPTPALGNDWYDVYGDESELEDDYQEYAHEEMYECLLETVIIREEYEREQEVKEVVLEEVVGEQLYFPFMQEVWSWMIN